MVSPNVFLDQARVFKMAFFFLISAVISYNLSIDGKFASNSINFHKSGSNKLINIFEIRIIFIYLKTIIYWSDY